MNIMLRRFQRTDQSTIGRIFLDDAFQCYSLEDTDRGDAPKVDGETCIPPGTYPVVLYQSPTHGLVPLLQNIPDFSMVEIHPGNDPADTRGCILPGSSYTDNWVGDSRAAFALLFHRIATAIQGGETVSITVE